MLLMSTVWLPAQTCTWSESFDATVTMIPGGTPGWSIDNSLFVSSANSYLGQYNTAGITLTSPSINLTGLNFVKLEFDQIAKIEFADTAIIEISINAGPWQKVHQNIGCIYEGPSLNFLSSNWKFSESSYFDWLPGQAVTPNNAWWKHEVFDISAVAGNEADVRIRFVIIDFGGNGQAGRYGWNLDNICVIGSPCETTPNTFDFSAYPYYDGNIYTDPGNWYVSADLLDNSGIQSAELYWTVNGGPVQQAGGMFNIQGNEWIAEILGPINIDDTVCWWIEAIDNSGCMNLGRWPATGCVEFILKGGISYPYCDDFDMLNPPFTDSLVSGTSPWELGTPFFGGGAHSAPNAWAVGLTAPYSSNAEVYLTSPIHDFTFITAANLSFWQNCDTEGSWDGTRMEYSTDGGATWNILGSGNDQNPDPNGQNWYTTDALFSSNTYAWEGSSNGWIESRYKLGFVPGLMGSSNVFFRYVFTSDGVIENSGFAIDDWCILLPDTIDAGVSAIVTPSCGTGLPEGDPFVLTVNVENFGLQALTGFNVVYQIGTGTPVVTPFPGTLNPNSAVPVTLTAAVVPAGAFNVCIWTDMTGDNSNLNDTICCSFSGIPTLIPTYCDDFEAGNIGWSANVEPGAPTTTVWELGLPAVGATSSANSGVNAWDINLNTQYQNQANCYLYSPYFDVSTISTGNLAFSINFNTENQWDGVRLEYTTNNGASWQVLGNGPTNASPFPPPPGTDPCGINWYNHNSLFSSGQPGWTGTSGGWVNVGYKLCCASGLFLNPTPIQFRFNFRSDFSVISDGFSIDDFCFYAGSGDDVGVSAIVAPSGGVPAGSAYAVVVTIENYGSSTVTSIPVSYTVNGGTPVTFTWTGTLAPCGVVTVTLPTSVFTQGTNVIQAYTNYPGDINPNNDTAYTSVIGQPIITPTYNNVYFDDFNSGNIGWAPSVGPGATTANIWELGVPNFGQTTFAHSIPDAWDVNLNTTVTANAYAILTTPYFDLTQATQATMRFWQNRNLNGFGDEFYVEYATGPLFNNWTRLGTSTSPGATNWYSNFDHWNLASAGWIFCEFQDLPSITGFGIVQFRFVLETAFGTRDGVSIDDFELFVPIPLSVTPLSVNTSIPNQLIFPGQPITFATPVKNNGINSVFNHNITLVIDGQTVSTGPVSYTPSGLSPNAVNTHNFPNTWIAVPGFHEVCVYTDSPNGAMDLNQFDDTVCTTVLVFDSVTTNQLPYCNSFESGNQWVTANAITYENDAIWEIGEPAQAFINAAHTGSKAWTTLLSADYINADSSGLFSSLMRVQANHCYKFNFFQAFRMEFGSDGGTLDYSDDYGVSWKPIDFAGTPNVVMFGPNTNYTYVSTLDPFNPAARGFTGYVNQWMYTEKVIRPNIDGQIIIRWRFASDYSTRDEGWAIDDFCFEDLGLCTPIGVNEFIYGDFGISQNYPNPASDMTMFEYLIPEQGQVRLTINNMLGQTVGVVQEQSQAAGTHTVRFNTADLAPGIYTYTLQFNDRQVTKRMMIAR